MKAKRPFKRPRYATTATDQTGNRTARKQLCDGDNERFCRRGGGGRCRTSRWSSPSCCRRGNCRSPRPRRRWARGWARRAAPARRTATSRGAWAACQPTAVQPQAAQPQAAQPQAAQPQAAQPQAAQPPLHPPAAAAAVAVAAVVAAAAAAVVAVAAAAAASFSAEA